MSEVRRHQVTIPPEQGGRRLDQALASLLGEYSRTQLTTWIKDGLVRLAGRPCKPRDPVAAGDQVDVEAQLDASIATTAEPVEFSTVFEDRAVIVVDKPAGLVVHPGAGNPQRTLVNGLLHRYPELDALPRAGLIHRLDKDTSGLLVVARTPRAFQRLVAAMAAREIHRTYSALVHGTLVAGGTVDAPIARDRRHRTRMRVTEGGREAVTHFRVARKFRLHTLLDVELETGRTHQIRVHLQHLGHPIVGDPDYGPRLRLPPGAAPVLIDAIKAFKRQALHARRLEFEHPSGRRTVAAESPLPADLAALLEHLATDTALAAFAQG